MLVPAMLIMAVLATVIMVMFVLFKINPVSSFNVIGTASVNMNSYARRRRQIATDADIHVGRTRQTRRGGQAWRRG